ncbi:hypothetical protein AOX55_00002726 [Sinorhizobium fredii CCBAU 25509]|nr:hypothetical protein AOX55_00002726 [Sinorhizobium fredii CCBAU 25509]
MLHEAGKIGDAIFSKIELNVWVAIKAVQQVNQLFDESFDLFSHATSPCLRPSEVGRLETVPFLRLLKCGGMRAVGSRYGW